MTYDIHETADDAYLTHTCYNLEFSLTLNMLGINFDFLYSRRIAYLQRRVIHIIFFLLLHRNICCAYSLEAPWQGASNEYQEVPWQGTSNEYHNICFHGEIIKIPTCFVEKGALSGAVK